MSNNDTIKFKRGQVWMVHLPKTIGTSVQSNDRPCIIISNNIGNESSSIITGLAVTSQPKKSCDINVTFKNNYGQENTVLCNQVFTIPVDNFSYYMYTLKDRTLEKVERAFLTANGMSQYIPAEPTNNLKNTPNTSTKPYREVLISEAIQREINPTPATPRKRGRPPKNTYDKSKLYLLITSSSVKPTEELNRLIEKLIEDDKVLSPNDLAEKYGFPSAISAKKAVTKYKYRGG